GADEADRDAFRREAGETCEEVGVGLRVRDDEVRGTERESVEGDERTRRQRARSKPTPVTDERVREGDERIEDNGATARGASGDGQVEVARVADEHDVERIALTPQESRFGTNESEGAAEPGAPLVLVALPDRLVPLDDLDAGAPQTRHDLRVARIAT